MIGRRVRHLDVLERLLDDPGRDRVLVRREVRDGPRSEKHLVEVQADPNIERPFDRVAKSPLVRLKATRIKAGVQFNVSQGCVLKLVKSAAFQRRDIALPLIGRDDTGVL